MKRRKFLMTGVPAGIAAAGSALGVSSSAGAMQPTPGEIEGPFYPVAAQE